MLQQMFSDAHSFPRNNATFVLQIDSVIDRCAETRESVVGYQATRVRCPST